MKECPILFSAPMVQAILSGNKTQTRRVAKGVAAIHSVTGEPLSKLDSAGPRVACPYGQVGDRLWVRETFADLRGTGVEHRSNPSGPLQRYAFAADCPPGSYRDEARKDFGVKWKPSIHMPRTASRITLEITDVRVERLQDISEADAMAEGIVEIERTGVSAYALHQSDPLAWQSAAGRYQMLWESINGSGSWDTNPWVWVIEFHQIDAATSAAVSL